MKTISIPSMSHEQPPLTILLIMQDNHSVVSSSCPSQPPQPPPPPAAPAAARLQLLPPPATASSSYCLRGLAGWLTQICDNHYSAAPHFNMIVQNNLPRLSPQRLSHCLSVSKPSLPGRYCTVLMASREVAMWSELVLSNKL